MCIISLTNGFCVDLPFANSNCMHLRAELSSVKKALFLLDYILGTDLILSIHRLF